MPRIPPWLFRRAKQASPNLAALLPACRDLESARNELRWIRGHVDETAPAGGAGLVSSLCRRRGRGEPLQYLLGSQPFGSLDIKCRPGVLIPRPETEAYTCHLAALISSGELLGRQPGHRSNGLSIIDFCTGTGCIPLLLFSLLQRHFKTLHVRGMDLSPTAVKVARDNIVHNMRAGLLPSPAAGQSLKIQRGDIFDDEEIKPLRDIYWDIMVSNPPYISRDVWRYGRGQLGSSVRRFEPRLALVPDDTSHVPPGWAHEDTFYHRLLGLAEILRPRAVLLEVGDEAQACRILTMLSPDDMGGYSHIELWRDWPDLQPTIDSEEGSLQITALNGRKWTVPAQGSGQIRAVLIRFGERDLFGLGT